ASIARVRMVLMQSWSRSLVFIFASGVAFGIVPTMANLLPLIQFRDVGLVISDPSASARLGLAAKRSTHLDLLLRAAYHSAACCEEGCPCAAEGGRKRCVDESKTRDHFPRPARHRGGSCRRRGLVVEISADVLRAGHGTERPA